jgi:phospholipase C
VTDTTPRGGGLSRRALLGGLAAAVGGTAVATALPETVRAAIKTSPKVGPFDLSKVKHVVVLMQENRSFDHYFGTLSGVRGFGDRTVEALPNGRPRWYQTDASNPDGYLLPYRLNTKITAAEAIPSMSHAWSIQHAAWNFGQMDNWRAAGRPVPVRPGRQFHHLRQLLLLHDGPDRSQPPPAHDRHD